MPADEAEPAEGGEQADPRDRRRQDERELDERDREVAEATGARVAISHAVGVPKRRMIPSAIRFVSTVIFSASTA